MTFPFAAILKVFVLVGVAVYVLFAAIVVKQVKIMSSTLRVGLEFPIKISSYLPLILAVLVFLFALLAL